MMTIIWIEQTEMPYLWKRMWDELALHEGDYLCENQGEIWQYMGSQVDNEQLIHHFRHRCHPLTQERENRKIITTFGKDPRGNNEHWEL